MQIETMKLADLKPADYNPRVELTPGMDEYGFCVPDSFSNYRISREVGYSERSIQRMKSEALIEFEIGRAHV